MLPIYALVVRELKRFFRSKSQVITSMGQPLLYLLIMGFGLGPVYQRAGGGNYLEYLAPGMIAMTVMFAATFSGMTVLWDRQFGMLKGTLVAPVSRVEITLGRTSGAAVVALVQGIIVAVVCVGAGFKVVTISMVPLGVLFLALIGLVFAALGTVIGATLRKLESFQVAMNCLILPIFLLSGAMFPLSHLPAVLGILTKIDPLAYGVDGLRAALAGQTFFGVGTDVSILTALAVVLISIGTWRVSEIES